MEIFSNLDNAYIRKVDSMAKERALESPLKNTLKTIVKISDFQVLDTAPGAIYNKKFTMDIPRSYDNLAQLYIKCYLGTGLDFATYDTDIGTKIFKKIVLQTSKGTVLQTITPEYIQMRIDEYKDSQLYTRLSSCIYPDTTFTASEEVEVYVPLFFFFSNSENLFLNTRNLEQLQLFLQTNDSKEAMSLSIDLTSARFELYALYHDIDESNKYSDQIVYKKQGLPKSLKGTFNIFEEDAQTVLAGAEKVSFILRCPYPAYAIHFTLFNPVDLKKEQIKNVKMKFGNREFLNLDYKMNFQLYGHNKGFVQDGTFSYYFSKLKDRVVDSGLITFSKEMSPCIVELTFLSQSFIVDYQLKTFVEYRSVHDVDEYGNISLNNVLRPIKEGQNSSNAVQAPADMTGEQLM